MNTFTTRIVHTFTEPLLAFSSGNRAIQEEFIASKAENQAAMDEEVAAIPATVDEQIEKATTVFPRDEESLHLWDYQIRGFFKEQFGALIDLGEITGLSKWAYKGAIHQFLMVSPRRIRLHKPDGSLWTKADGTVQRPLRATTMQGDRVALASSESLPPGTWLEYTVTLYLSKNDKAKTKIKPEWIKAAVDWGALHGFGQWRSGGWGRFEVKMEEKDEK
jgi:hypothetical protein